MKKKGADAEGFVLIPRRSTYLDLAFVPYYD